MAAESGQAEVELGIVAVERDAGRTTGECIGRKLGRGRQYPLEIIAAARWAEAL